MGIIIKNPKEKIMARKMLVDLYCPVCEDVEMIDIWYDNDVGIIDVCPKCNGKMEKMVAKRMSFELKYDPQKDIVDWQGNKSQYYRAYNEAKARGENVKPHGADNDGRR